MAKKNFANGQEVYLLHPESGMKYRGSIVGKREMDKREHDVYIVRFVDRPVHYNEYPWECTLISEKYLTEVENVQHATIARRRSWYEELEIMQNDYGVAGNGVVGEEIAEDPAWGEADGDGPQFADD